MWGYTWIIESMIINWGWEVIGDTNPQHQYSSIVLESTRIFILDLELSELWEIMSVSHPVHDILLC